MNVVPQEYINELRITAEAEALVERVFGAER